MLRTKIVCTLGPASSDPATIQALVDGGLDVARINMSHGRHAEHRGLIEAVRAAADRAGRPVAILADLAGPKIRVGDLPEPVTLEEGATVVLAQPGAESEGDIPTTYAHLAEDLSPGDRVLLDDGLLELECTGTEGGRAFFTVVRGGLLRSRKGLNLPGVDLQAPSLTPKDLADLDFALGVGVEYVGLSFVRRASDVIDLKSRVGKRTLVVAKIEMARAMDALEEILEATDAVMVARGDLGVELPYEQVPLAQKRIVQQANFHGRPVITATQMLESMIEHPRPTRAEASDVANAILDGTDGVMLSGETAVGAYPVRALEAMVRIASEIEKSGVLEYGPLYDTVSVSAMRSGASGREHAVAAATVSAARQLGSPGIIVITRSGFAARLVSSYRPPVPVFAVCTDALTYRQLAAVWGVRPVLADVEEVSYETLTRFGCRAVIELGSGKEGDHVPVTSGYPFHESGTTNTMRVETL
ncbi:MAG: pyruvate kinase [Gemmatimonadetes bacterium]|nr:MAG: pyruvate kinase [Gemmatimonadota bacterium]